MAEARGLGPRQCEFDSHRPYARLMHTRPDSRLKQRGYLGWLAFKAIRPNGTSVFAPVTLSADSPRRLFSMALLTNLLNPKAAVMYLSLIPQFERPAVGHLVAQGFILGSAQILRMQQYLMGTVLGALAVKLATDHARPVPA